MAHSLPRLRPDRAARAPGAGCPRSSPGCPRRPAPGCRGARSCCAPPGSRSPCTARGRLAPLEAEAALAQSGPPGPVLVQVFLAGRDRLGLGPRPDRGRRLPAPAARGSRSRPARATCSARTRACAGIRRRAALAALHAEGKVSVMPAVGYDHPDQSHFVSRHFYEVGALDPQTTTGWLGRYLDRVGSPDNPLQGLALDNSLAPALAARARARSRRSTSPTDYNFWARDVWGDIEPIMLDATARIGVVHQRSEPALAQVAAAAMHTGALRWQLARAARGRRRARPFTPPVDLSGVRGVRLPRAARRARGDARRRAAAALRRDHRARRLRHAREPGRDARRAAEARLRRARRVPARPRGARPGRPGAGPRAGRSSAAARPRTPRAPTTAPRGSGC